MPYSPGFSRAIAVITIVASAIFLLCIMLLKVEERRRDVAALRLMGISRATVMRAVVIEAALLALVGSALGVEVGTGLALLPGGRLEGSCSCRSIASSFALANAP